MCKGEWERGWLEVKERKARRIIRVGMKKVENRKHTHDSSFNQVPTIGQEKKKGYHV